MCRSQKCGVAMFILVLVGDVFDFIMDWLFYDEIRNAEDGLVLGPHDSTVVTATLVFCIIGTVTFIIEFIINILECRDSDESKLICRISEVMTMITLLIEDLPQIIINFDIALCREEVTSVVQITKAVSALVEVIILVTILSVKYWQAKREEEISGSRTCVFVITVVISLVIAVFSSAVFGLETNFNKEKIVFDSHSLEGKEADRYILGVDVFMKSQPFPNMTGNQWMNITDIKTLTSFQEQSANIVVSVLVNEQYVWLKKQSTTSGETLSCDHATPTSTTSPLPPAKCRELLSNAIGGTRVTVKLEYVLPNRHQPLGDILYNYRVTDYNCRTISSPVTLQYFKEKSVEKNSRLFTPSTDLDDVRDVWKTGRASCTSTARERPKLSSAIIVPCGPLV